METSKGINSLKQPNKLPEKDSSEGYVDFRNPFEDYPELAERLLHAANFWKVDDTWSTTLAEINKVCEQLTIAKNANWESKYLTMKNENKQPENGSLSAFADKKQKEGVFYSTIGANIIRGRNALGMTQEILADKLGISRVSIGNIESGKQRLPVHLMYDVAKVLNIDLMGLFKGIDRSFAKQPASLPESKEVESVPFKSAEEIALNVAKELYIESMWQSKDFKHTVKVFTRVLNKHLPTNPIEVIKNRIKELDADSLMDSAKKAVRLRECKLLLKLIQ